MKNRSKAGLAARAVNRFSCFLSDPCRLSNAQVLPASFTRNRKISLDRLLSFLIFRRGKTISEEMDFFFQSLNDPPSSQALVKRESILNYDIWPEIFETQRRCFYDSGLLSRTYKGYQVIAIDGSKVILPPSPALNQVFGGALNKYISTREELQTPVAHHSAAYDPVNHQVLNYIAAPYNISEIPMMFDHLDHLLPWLEGKKVLLLMDRYYGSVELFKWCESHGFDYIVRAKSNFFKDIRSLIPEHQMDAGLEIELNSPWLRRLKRDDVKVWASRNPTVKVRLVKNDYQYVELERKESKRNKGKYYNREKTIEVHTEYFTSLSASAFSREEIVEMYHTLRWDIETYFDTLKNDLELERFHTANPIAIINQTMGKVVFSNLAGLIQTLADEELDDEEYIPNVRRIIQNLYSYEFLKKFMNGKIKKKDISRMISVSLKSKSAVRKGRHYKRWNRFMKKIPQKKFRIGGRSNPKVTISKNGGYITTNH